MKTTSKSITFMVAILATTAPFAAALPNSGRRITGTILKVEPRVREAGMRWDDKGTVIAFSWNDRTTFVSNATFTDAAILQPKARVNVIYHAPFFGKPFVSRVRLAMPPATALANK